MAEIVRRRVHKYDIKIKTLKRLFI